ncbi:hypothetical protein EDB85DRAFT_1888165 [Lactarius pseudohatsudake]|nr:hypothetical protein EDB85DRAFT_1888165 [Lactarius pseudohatsudake]
MLRLRSRTVGEQCKSTMGTPTSTGTLFSSLSLSRRRRWLICAGLSWSPESSNNVESDCIFPFWWRRRKTTRRVDMVECDITHEDDQRQGQSLSVDGPEAASVSTRWQTHSLIRGDDCCIGCTQSTSVLSFTAELVSHGAQRGATYAQTVLSFTADLVSDGAQRGATEARRVRRVLVARNDDKDEVRKVKRTNHANIPFSWNDLPRSSSCHTRVIDANVGNRLDLEPQPDESTRATVPQICVSVCVILCVSEKSNWLSLRAGLASCERMYEYLGIEATNHLVLSGGRCATQYAVERDKCLVVMVFDTRVFENGSRIKICSPRGAQQRSKAIGVAGARGQGDRGSQRTKWSMLLMSNQYSLAYSSYRMMSCTSSTGDVHSPDVNRRRESQRLRRMREYQLKKNSGDLKSDKISHRVKKRRNDRVYMLQARFSLHPSSAPDDSTEVDCGRPIEQESACTSYHLSDVTEAVADCHLPRRPIPMGKWTLWNRPVLEHIPDLMRTTLASERRKPGCTISSHRGSVWVPGEASKLGGTPLARGSSQDHGGASGARDGARDRVEGWTTGGRDSDNFFPHPASITLVPHGASFTTCVLVQLPLTRAMLGNASGFGKSPHHQPHPTALTRRLETTGRCSCSPPPPLPFVNLRPPLGVVNPGLYESGKRNTGPHPTALTRRLETTGRCSYPPPPPLPFVNLRPPLGVSCVREPLAPPRRLLGQSSLCPVLPPFVRKRGGWTDEALSILRTIRTTGYKPGPADEPPRPVPVSAPVVTGPRIQSLESTSASWHQVGQGSDALEDALPLPREMDPISCWLKQRKAGEAIANASGALCEDNGLGMERDVSVHEAGTANTARQDGVGKLSSTAVRKTASILGKPGTMLPSSLLRHWRVAVAAVIVITRLALAGCPGGGRGILVGATLASTLRQSTSTTPSLRKTRTDATPPRCNPFTANLAVAPTRDSGPHHHQLAATPPQHGAQNGANAPRKGPTVWPSLAARMRRASPTADND